MNASIDDAKDALLRPGMTEDTYYADAHTALKQKIPTIIQSRFTSAFQALSGGVNTFLAPPSNGYSDFIAVLRMPDLTGVAGDLALNRGWGYDLIERVSFRVAGSSQYFLTGQQVKLLAMKNSPSDSAKDAILALGGQAASTAGQFAALGARNFAYVYITLPGTVGSRSNKPVPIASDTITQSIQITVELKPLSAIFSNNGGTVPTSLASGTFQAVQIDLQNAGDALARHRDLATSMYVTPVTFTQQATQVACANTAQPQTLNLVGFRAGRVKEITLWLTKGSDDAATARNGGSWYEPVDIQVSYSGQVYFRSDGRSSELLNLINQKATSSVNTTRMSYGGGAYTESPAVTRWVNVPFAQAWDGSTYENVATGGLSVTNGIIQVQLVTADANGIPTAAADYVLNASYDYSAVAVFSQGTCEFGFP